jgi:hypothetical protein
MGNTTTNSTDISNSVNNNFLTVTDNSCNSTATVKITNVLGKLTLLGGAKGDINFGNANGTLTSYCSIDQQLSQSATAIMKAASAQTASTENEFLNMGVLFSRDHNDTDISQSMVNNMVTNTSNNCNATASTEISNSAISVNKTGGKGNITIFSVGNDTTSTCTISNSVGQESYADLQANSDQAAKTMGMFAAIAAALVTGMVVLLLGVLVIFGGGALLVGGYKMSGKKTGKKSGGAGSAYNPPQNYGEEEGEGEDYGEEEGEDYEEEDE